jgi:hypothetical protein
MPGVKYITMTTEELITILVSFKNLLVVVLVMDIKQHIDYVKQLQKEAVLSGNWEAADRFGWLLYLLYKDLAEERRNTINSLRRMND